MRKLHGWNVILAKGSFRLVEWLDYGLLIHLSSVRLSRSIWAGLMSRSTIHSPPRTRASPLPRFIYSPNMSRRIHSRNPKSDKPLHLRTRPSPSLPLCTWQDWKRGTTSDKYPRMGKRARGRTPKINRNFHITISRIHFRIGRANSQWTR